MTKSYGCGNQRKMGTATTEAPNGEFGDFQASNGSNCPTTIKQ